MCIFSFTLKNAAKHTDLIQRRIDEVKIYGQPYTDYISKHDVHGWTVLIAKSFERC